MITNERLAEMIKAIKPFAKMPCGIKINELSSKDILAALSELQERRETELRPATKFLVNSLMKQFDHLKSEIFEVDKALAYIWTDRNKNPLAEELVDLQMSAETMLTILGADIPEVRRKVIAKNAARGYYEVDNDEA